MSIQAQIASSAIQVLHANPTFPAIEISTTGYTRTDVAILVNALVSEAELQKVSLKGIAVDASLLPLPSNAPFLNAYQEKGVTIVLDLSLNDLVVVRR